METAVEKIIHSKVEEQKPCRVVEYFHSLDGNFLASSDPAMIPVLREDFMRLRSELGEKDKMLSTIWAMVTDALELKIPPKAAQIMREILDLIPDDDEVDAE